MAVYRYHGNYCGPGWTAGKYMSAEDATEEDFDVPALSPQDKCCKYHDLHIWLASKESDPVRRRQMEKQADQVFVNDLSKLDHWLPLPDLMSWAVWALGPGAKLRGTVRGDGSLTNFPPKRHIDLKQVRERMSLVPVSGKSFRNLHYGRDQAFGRFVVAVARW